MFSVIFLLGVFHLTNNKKVFKYLFNFKYLFKFKCLFKFKGFCRTKGKLHMCQGFKMWD